MDELPFDFVRKRMSVVIDYEDMHVLICKGAVEEVYGVSTHYQVDDDIYPLFDVVKSDLMEEYQRLSSDGYRVLAVAYKEFPKDKEAFSAADEAGLTLLGYLRSSTRPRNRPRRRSRAWKRRACASRSSPATTSWSRATSAGTWGWPWKPSLRGRQLASLSEAGCKAVIEGTAFARLSPMQKESIITCLQRQGMTVGFLGRRHQRCRGAQGRGRGNSG